MAVPASVNAVQFRMVVLEEKLVEKLKNALKSKKKVIKFSELANRKV